MRNLRSILFSGLIGIGIGMIWMAVNVLLSLNGQRIETAKLYLMTFLFWLAASFFIGIFFSLASWIFDNEKWSLRKQIIVNFFVCFGAWFLFSLLINDFSISWNSLIVTVIDFVIMYVIAYGGYFFQLWNSVRQINAKLKEK